MLSAKWIPYIIVAIIFSYNPPWPIFGFSSEIGMLLSLLLLVCVKKRSYTVLHLKHFFSLLLLSLFFLLTHLFTGLSYSYFIYIGIFYYCYKYLNEEDSIVVVRWITNILAIVLGVSLIAWFIHNHVYSLPCQGEIDISAGKGAEATMSNYFFFVQSDQHIDFVNRFYSIFDEPGVVGTLSSFILFVNRYDFKNNKRLIVILIAAIFTFSLAFYVLTIVGYLYIALKERRIKFTTFIPISLIIFLFIFFIGQMEEFNYVIMSRFDEGLGSSLENRTSHNVNFFYKKNTWTIDWFLGLGKDGMIRNGLIEGSSYKVFILREGFFALLSLIYAYSSIIKKYNSYTYAFFFLFWLSFLQRPSAMNAGFIMTFAVCAFYLSADFKNLKSNKYETTGFLVPSV